MPSPEQLEELQKLLPQAATPDTTLAVINGHAIAAKNLVAELSKIPRQDISSLIEDLKTLDKLDGKEDIRQIKAQLSQAKEELATCDENARKYLQLIDDKDKQLSQWQECAREQNKAIVAIYDSANGCIDLQEYTGLLEGYSFHHKSTVDNNLKKVLSLFTQLTQTKEKE